MRTNDALALVGRGVAAGLRLGRGTADRAVRMVGPQVTRVAKLVTTRGRQAPAATTTFTPSAPPPPATATAKPEAPSPASVASNIAPQRPVAKPTKAPPKPKSVPGAKLPPRSS